MNTLVYCDCGDLAVALIGEDEIALCLTHYVDILELASHRTREPGRGRLMENVTTGGVL